MNRKVVIKSKYYVNKNTSNVKTHARNILPLVFLGLFILLSLVLENDAISVLFMVNILCNRIKNG